MTRVITIQEKGSTGKEGKENYCPDFHSRDDRARDGLTNEELSWQQ